MDEREVEEEVSRPSEEQDMVISVLSRMGEGERGWQYYLAAYSALALALLLALGLCFLVGNILFQFLGGKSRLKPEVEVQNLGRIPVDHCMGLEGKQCLKKIREDITQFINDPTLQKSGEFYSRLRINVDKTTDLLKAACTSGSGKSPRTFSDFGLVDFQKRLQLVLLENYYYKYFGVWFNPEGLEIYPLLITREVRKLMETLEGYDASRVVRLSAKALDRHWEYLSFLDKLSGEMESTYAKSVLDYRKRAVEGIEEVVNQITNNPRCARN